MRILQRLGVTPALFALFVASATTSHAGDQIAVTAKQQQSLGIETAPLAGQKGAGDLSVPGRVVIPNGQIQAVSTPLAGLVQRMLVTTNDAVKKSQLMATVSSPMLLEAQRDYLQAATQVQLAQSSVKRDEQLFKEGIIAEGRYLAARSNHVQAAASFAEKRRALQLYGMSDSALARLSAGALSSNLEITAPFDGAVLEQMVTVGQRAEAATPLYKVAKLEPLWLELQLPVAMADRVAPGAAITIPAYQAAGKLVSIGRNVNPANQTVMARAEIGAGAKNLKAGQFVEANVAARQDTSATHWRIPTTALVRQQQKAYVFVRTPGGFRPQEVSVLGESADGVAISGNLQGNETIAVKGVASLKASWMGLGGGE